MTDGPGHVRKENRVRYLLQRGEAEESEGQHYTAVATFSEALELARQERDSNGEAEALMGRARAHVSHGDPESAMEDSVRALELFEKAEDSRGMALACRAIGGQHAKSGQFGVAEHFLRDFLKLASNMDDRRLMAKAHMDLGDCLLGQEKFNEALAQYRQAITALKNAGAGPETFDIVLVYEHMAEVFTRKEDHTAAVYYLTKAEEAARHGGHSEGHARILAVLAESLVRVGNIERAQLHLQEGMEFLTMRNDHAGMMSALRVKGLLHRRLHEFETAADYLAEALRVSREVGSLQDEVLTLLEMARLNTDLGKPDAALKALVEAETICRDRTCTRLRAEVCRLKADIEKLTM